VLDQYIIGRLIEGEWRFISAAKHGKDFVGMVPVLSLVEKRVYDDLRKTIAEIFEDINEEVNFTYHHHDTGELSVLEVNIYGTLPTIDEVGDIFHADFPIMYVSWASDNKGNIQRMNELAKKFKLLKMKTSDETPN